MLTTATGQQLGASADVNSAGVGNRAATTSATAALAGVGYDVYNTVSLTRITWLTTYHVI